MTHEHIAEFTAHTDEGGIELHEWNCGAKYVITDKNGEYCPNCGEKLGDRDD